MTDELVTRLRDRTRDAMLKDQDRMEAAATIARLEGERDVALAANRGLVRLNEITEARAEAKVAALVELLTEAKLMVNYATLAGKRWHDATDAAIAALRVIGGMS